MVVLLAAFFALALVLLLWLWAIGPQLPQADFSAFHKYDYAHGVCTTGRRACRRTP